MVIVVAVDFIVENFVLIVIGLFLVAVVLEIVAPATAPTESITQRWWRNFGLGLIDNVANRGIGAILASVFAAYIQDSALGLLNNVNGHPILVIIIGFALLDLKDWAFHWLTHNVGWLWRFHQVHHCDSNIDVSTGLRFHPIESLITGLITLAIIAFLGIPPEVMILRAVVIYAVNFFTHTNVRLPHRLDWVLRLLIVTPNMHRIHHAPAIVDANSNYGAIFSCWDRLFGSYRQVSSQGPNGLQVGLETLPNAQEIGLWGLLKLPFLSNTQSQQTNGVHHSQH